VTVSAVLTASRILHVRRAAVTPRPRCAARLRDRFVRVRVAKPPPPAWAEMAAVARAFTFAKRSVVRRSRHRPFLGTIPWRAHRLRCRCSPQLGCGGILRVRHSRSASFPCALRGVPRLLLSRRWFQHPSSPLRVRSRAATSRAESRRTLTAYVSIPVLALIWPALGSCMKRAPLGGHPGRLRTGSSPLPGPPRPGPHR